MQRMYCRWPWSSPYIVVTPTWCANITQRHAFGWISTRALHPTESHLATIPHRDLGGSCSKTSWDPEWQLIRPSNGTLHRVFACSEGGPGFDSQLRRNILRCSMQRMWVALVKPLHYYVVQTMHSRSLAGKCRMSILLFTMGSVASFLFLFLHRSTRLHEVH